MPFLAVCPECHYSQVCVLPTGVFPRIKCCRCRGVYDPVGTEDTEVIPELAGATVARLVLERRAMRARMRAIRERRRRKARRRARRLATAGVVAAPPSTEAIAAAVLSEPLPVPAAVLIQSPPPPETVGGVDQGTVPDERRPIPRRPVRRQRTDPEVTPESAVVCGWLAVILAGLSLTGSQFSYGWWVALGLSSVGVVLGTRAVRQFTTPLTAAAAGVNVLLVTILLLAPSWLGVRPGRLAGDGGKPPSPVAVGRQDTVAPVGDGWVDVTQSAWQWEDVRVTATRPTVSSARLRGPGGQTKLTGRQYLTVKLHIRNEGVARDIPVPVWEAVGPTAPRLTTENGVRLPPAVFETGWAPATTAKRMLGPGQASDCFLYFELPSDKLGRCQLEVPGAPLGVAGDIRLKLP